MALWAEGTRSVKGRTKGDTLRKQQGEWLARKDRMGRQEPVALHNGRPLGSCEQRCTGIGEGYQRNRAGREGQLGLGWVQRGQPLRGGSELHFEATADWSCWQAGYRRKGEQFRVGSGFLAWALGPEVIGTETRNRSS